MPKSITAAGGVVFSVTERKPAVLLIHRNAVWDIPKGKLEKGESVAMCAAREVAEETGAELPSRITSNMVKLPIGMQWCFQEIRR